MFFFSPQSFLTRRGTSWFHGNEPIVHPCSISVSLKATSLSGSPFSIALPSPWAQSKQMMWVQATCSPVDPPKCPAVSVSLKLIPFPWQDPLEVSKWAACQVDHHLYWHKHTRASGRTVKTYYRENNMIHHYFSVSLTHALRPAKYGVKLVIFSHLLNVLFLSCFCHTHTYTNNALYFRSRWKIEFAREFVIISASHCSPAACASLCLCLEMRWQRLLLSLGPIRMSCSSFPPMLSHNLVSPSNKDTLFVTLAYR